MRRIGIVRRGCLEIVIKVMLCLCWLEGLVIRDKEIRDILRYE